jgi:hypothetical protein
MNASHDNVIVPSLHDRLTDAGCRPRGFRDEQPDDAFPRHGADDPQYVADMQAIEAARDGGSDPRPPTSGAIRPEVNRWAALAARTPDDELLAGIGMADADPRSMLLDTPAEQAEFLDAFSAEVLRRLAA